MKSHRLALNWKLADDRKGGGGETDEGNGLLQVYGVETDPTLNSVKLSRCTRFRLGPLCPARSSIQTSLPDVVRMFRVACLPNQLSGLFPHGRAGGVTLPTGRGGDRGRASCHGPHLQFTGARELQLLNKSRRRKGLPFLCLFWGPVFDRCMPLKASRATKRALT